MNNKRLLFNRTKQSPNITRSDNAVVYTDLHDCIDAIQADYGEKLTQDVVVTVNNKSIFRTQDRPNFPDFYYHMNDFNNDSDYFLTINGNNNLVMDGSTTGSFKFTTCSNIIISNTRFINISSHTLSDPPEQTCAVFAQGTSEYNIRNIIIHNCYVEGRYYANTTINQGRFGFIFKYCDNVSLTNVSIRGMALYWIEAVGLDSLSLSNVSFKNGIVNHYIVSQPCGILVKSVELLYIEDSDFNLLNTETGVRGSNLVRFIAKRTNFRNANGEALRFDNSIDMKLVDIEFCIFDSNLKNSLYYYVNQHIVFNNIEVVNFKNNTVKLTPSTAVPYARFFRGDSIGILNTFNNVYTIVMNVFNNNNAQAILFSLSYLEEWNSDYNVYQDVLLNNNDELTNLLLSVESDNSPVALSNLDELSTLQATGRDLNSIFVALSTPIFNTGLDDVTSVVSAINIPFTDILYDYNKNIISENITNTSLHPGASQLNSETPVIDNIYKYYGIDSFNETRFNEEATYNPYSNSKLFITVISNSKSLLYKWVFEDENGIIYIQYGTTITTRLLSLLDNNGDYTGTLTYNLNLTDVNL